MGDFEQGNQFILL